MPDQNHPNKVTGLVSGAYPNMDHPNTIDFSQGEGLAANQPDPEEVPAAEDKEEGAE